MSTEHDCLTPPLNDEERAEVLEDLADVLGEIQAHDTDYDHRYGLVLVALSFASLAGLEAGIRIDPAESDWPAVYIELPTGQVSWHMPAHKPGFDGHTTEEKYARVRQFIDKIDHHQNHEADRG